MLANLKKFVAPIGEALVAICRLFGIGTGIVFQPIDEEVAVFLQDQELSEDDISLKIRNKMSSAIYDSCLRIILSCEEDFTIQLILIRLSKILLVAKKTREMK